MGEFDIDAEWDNFQQSLIDADLDLVTEEANEVYAASGRG